MPKLVQTTQTVQSFILFLSNQIPAFEFNCPAASKLGRNETILQPEFLKFHTYVAVQKSAPTCAELQLKSTAQNTAQNFVNIAEVE